MKKRVMGALAVGMITLLGVVGLAATGATTSGGEDVDAFMSKVLEQRRIDWDELHNFVFRERETLEIRGGLGIPALESYRKEYVWIVRDGTLVRSPVSINGVDVPADERRREEQQWRQQNRKKDGTVKTPGRDSFFRFKFEPGNYLFAGHRHFQGRDLVVVEYYPRHLFADEKNGSEDDKYETMLDKTSRVTMLVDPATHQMIHVEFENAGLDFLPGRWLVRIDELQAAMTMGKPFNKVWLPATITAVARVRTAAGSLDIHFKREFRDYQRTKVRVKLRFDTDREVKHD